MDLLAKGVGNLWNIPAGPLAHVVNVQMQFWSAHFCVDAIAKINFPMINHRTGLASNKCIPYKNQVN